MITAYVYDNRHLTVTELGILDSIPSSTIWLDLYKPDDEEREWLSHFSVEEVPDEEDINEIEASARFYQNSDGLHINSLFPQRVGQDVPRLRETSNQILHQVMARHHAPVQASASLRHKSRAGFDVHAIQPQFYGVDCDI